MSSSALANRYSARMGDALGGAFHVTYVENLPNIVRCGLVPGGIGGGNRLALHCGAFAPWDKMNLATKTSPRNLRVGDPIAIIHIPSATLARYGAGVAFNGTFMVFDVIPFYEIKSIWIGKCNKGDAWTSRTSSGRTQNASRTRSVLVSLVRPKSRP